MEALAVLPGESVLVRGGVATAQNLASGAFRHFRDCGVYAISLWSVPGLDGDEIARVAREQSEDHLPHRQMQTSTVGRLRTYGYELVPTGPDGHYSLMLPSPPTDVDWDNLMAAFDKLRSCSEEERVMFEFFQLLVDFNDIRQGRVSGLQQFASGPRDLRAGDLVLLHDDGEHNVWGTVVSLQRDLVEVELDWRTWVAVTDAAAGDQVTGMSPQDRGSVDAVPVTSRVVAFADGAKEVLAPEPENVGGPVPVLL